MRVAPDDEIFRARLVWLGPTGASFPWVARYLAYAVGLAVFLGILLFEAATPLKVSIVPVWELSITVVATYGLLTFIDHERPLRSVWQTLMADLRAPRPEKSRPVEVVNRTRIVRRYTTAVHTWRAR